MWCVGYTALYSIAASTNAVVGPGEKKRKQSDAEQNRYRTVRFHTLLRCVCLDMIGTFCFILPSSWAHYFALPRVLLPAAFRRLRWQRWRPCRKMLRARLKPQVCRRHLPLWPLPWRRRPLKWQARPRPSCVPPTRSAQCLLLWQRPWRWVAQALKPPLPWFLSPSAARRPFPSCPLLSPLAIAIWGK